MTRLTSLLLCWTVIPAAVLAGPVLSRPAPTPHPVPASLQEIQLLPTVIPTAVSMPAADPAPTDPAPTDPAPTDPAPTDPAPTDPAPTDPAPDGPASAADVSAARELAADGRRTIVATQERTTEPFQALGVTWASDPAVGEVAVTARTRTRGRWTDWAVLGEEAAAGSAESAGARAGTEPSWVGESDGVQLRVALLSGAAPRDVRLTLIDPGTSAADAPATVLGAAVAHAASTTPAIRTRAQWGADESIRRSSQVADTLQAVTLHHSASSNSYEPADVPAIMRSFYAYHVTSRGWADIGYNVLVDKFGTAWEGRYGGLSKPVIGAHAGGFNTATSGISMIGTYESVRPPAVMLETVAQVAAWKLRLHGHDADEKVTLSSAGSTKHRAGTAVTLPRIFAHRDVTATSCPGTQGMASLPGIRERASQLIAAAPTVPPDPFGTLDPARPGDQGTQVSGWTIDPDASDFTRVELSVDGAPARTVVADAPRPDLAAAYPRYNQNHGFDTVLPLAPGSRTICATAENQNDGGDHELGCIEVLVARTATPSTTLSPIASPTPTPSATASPATSPTASPIPSPTVTDTASATPTAEPTPSAPSPNLVRADRTRLAGADRYLTAAAIVRRSFPDGAVPVVLIAAGDTFADALAGGPAADALGAPVLPVSRAGIPLSIQTELSRLQPAAIVILGGAGAVSDATAVELQRFTQGTVTRIAGTDRYDTAARVATATFAVGVPHVLVANGRSFPDALAAGAVGAAADSPVLLVPADGVPTHTASALRALKPGSITVLGGTAAVSDAVLDELRSHTAGPVTRLAGQSRYTTAARMAQAFWPQTSQVVYLATGQDFPDALTGVPAAGRDRAPLLLVEPNCMPASTRRELDRLAPSSVVVLGGTQTVSEAAASGSTICATS